MSSLWDWCFLCLAECSSGLIWPVVRVWTGVNGTCIVPYLEDVVHYWPPGKTSVNKLNSMIMTDSFSENRHLKVTRMDYRISNSTWDVAPRARVKQLDFFNLSQLFTLPVTHSCSTMYDFVIELFGQNVHQVKPQCLFRICSFLFHSDSIKPRTFAHRCIMCYLVHLLKSSKIKYI